MFVRKQEKAVLGLMNLASGDSRKSLRLYGLLNKWQVTQRDNIEAEILNFVFSPRTMTRNVQLLNVTSKRLRKGK